MAAVVAVRVMQETMLVVGEELRPYQRVELRAGAGGALVYWRYLSSTGDRWIRHGPAIFSLPDAQRSDIRRLVYQDGRVVQPSSVEAVPLGGLPDEDASPPVTLVARRGGPTRRRARMIRVSPRAFERRQIAAVHLPWIGMLAASLLALAAARTLDAEAGFGLAAPAAKGLALLLGLLALVWLPWSIHQHYTGLVAEPKVSWRAELDADALHLTTARYTTTIPLAAIESATWVERDDWDQPQDWTVLRLRGGGRVTIPGSTVWRGGRELAAVMTLARRTV